MAKNVDLLVHFSGNRSPLIKKRQVKDLKQIQDRKKHKYQRSPSSMFFLKHTTDWLSKGFFVEKTPGVTSTDY